MPESEPPLTPLSVRAKWIVALCIGVIVLGLEFFICKLAYENGHDAGYAAGKMYTPPVVIKQSDEKALKQLSEFVEEASSSAESLANLLKNREERMAWIRDPRIRLETAWNLTRELINHDGVKNAFPIAKELIEQGYVQGDKKIWAQRAEFFANAVLVERRYGDAQGYLQFVAEVYEQLGMTAELVATLQKMSSVALLMGNTDKAKQLLERAWAKSAPLGPEKTQSLKCRLLVVRGCMNRDSGKPEDARKCFDDAIAIVPAMQLGRGFSVAPEDVPLRVALAEAFLEAGKRQEARGLLDACLKVTEKAAPQMLMDRLTILRGLARIESEAANYKMAQSYLDQAYGAAVGVVAQTHPFWPHFYSQRGWMRFMSMSDGATQDFNAAMAHPAATPLIGAQCQEGLGREAFNKDGAVNQAEAPKYSEHFMKAVSIREAALPQDTLALGRVHYYHGQLWDMAGVCERAQEAYAKAVACLLKWPQGPERDHFLIESGLSDGYALCDMARWQDAVNVFETVLPLMEGDRKSECWKQLGRCYDELGNTAKGDECWKESGYPRVRITSPRRRR